MARPRVLVVGGGFGGLSCARRLARGEVDVLLLDRHNYHLFTPLLYQVATALLDPSDIAYPFRAVFRRSRGVRFRQASVSAVDLDRRRVRTDAGDELDYDYLVMATGSVNDYFGNERVARAALGMKDLEEARALRNHVLACLERAARSTDERERRRLLTFVVVGGGPTGVEYCGALGELLRLCLGREYPELAPDLARIVLVEGRDRLLPGFAPKLGRYAESTLAARGIEVRTGLVLEDASGEHATLSNGEVVETGTVVWSAGVTPADPTAQPGLGRSRSRRLEVDEFLRVRGHDRVFAIGDLAAASASGRRSGAGDGELPMLSPVAMQGGRYVADLILRSVSSNDRGALPPFRYRDKGTMAVIGRNAAVADVHGIKLKGFLGWMAWLLVHIYYLIGFRNRLVVLASWGWNYVRKDRPIRIILGDAGMPGAKRTAPAPAAPANGSRPER